MSSSPEWLRLIWEVMVTLISGGAALYAFVHMRHAARQSETAALASEIVSLKHGSVDKEETRRLWDQVHEIDARRANSAGELKDRIKDLESAQKHMPTASEVASLIANVELMKETMTGLRAQLQTMDDYLRKHER